MEEVIAKISREIGPKWVVLVADLKLLTPRKRYEIEARHSGQPKPQSYENCAKDCIREWMKTPPISALEDREKAGVLLSKMSKVDGFRALASGIADSEGIEIDVATTTKIGLFQSESHPSSSGSQKDDCTPVSEGSPESCLSFAAESTTRSFPSGSLSAPGATVMTVPTVISVPRTFEGEEISREGVLSPVMSPTVTSIPMNLGGEVDMLVGVTLPTVLSPSVASAPTAFGGEAIDRERLLAGATVLAPSVASIPRPFGTEAFDKEGILINTHGSMIGKDKPEIHMHTSGAGERTTKKDFSRIAKLTDSNSEESESEISRKEHVFQTATKLDIGKVNRESVLVGESEVVVPKQRVLSMGPRGEVRSDNDDAASILSADSSSTGTVVPDRYDIPISARTRKRDRYALLDISQRLAAEKWEVLGECLRLERSFLGEISGEEVEERYYLMLKKWVEVSGGNATFSKLHRVLVELEENTAVMVLEARLESRGEILIRAIQHDL